MKQGKWAVVALLAALAVLVALPGCFWDGGHRGHDDGERHEEHRDGDRHDEGHHER